MLKLRHNSSFQQTSHPSTRKGAFEVEQAAHELFRVERGVFSLSMVEARKECIWKNPGYLTWQEIVKCGHIGQGTFDKDELRH